MFQNFNGLVNIRGTSVDDNKISVNLHIHIHSSDENLINKIGRILNGIIGKRHEAVEGAAHLPESELQKNIIRVIKDR